MLGNHRRRLAVTFGASRRRARSRTPTQPETLGSRGPGGPCPAGGHRLHGQRDHRHRRRVGDHGRPVYVIDQANANANTDGSLIEFDPKVFATPQSIVLTKTLTLSETAGPEVISGPGANLVTVSGNNAVEVFSVSTGVTAALSGLTISSGRASQGGGLYIEDSTVSLTKVVITHNQAVGVAGASPGVPGGAGLGGGIYLADGGLTMKSDVVSSNSARGGAGGHSAAGGAAAGGGIYVAAGSLAIDSNTIRSNMALGGAGGAAKPRGTTEFSGGFDGGPGGAAAGGGLYVATGTLELTGSTFQKDAADGRRRAPGGPATPDTGMGSLVGRVARGVREGLRPAAACTIPGTGRRSARPTSLRIKPMAVLGAWAETAWAVRTAAVTAAGAVRGAPPVRGACTSPRAPWNLSGAALYGNTVGGGAGGDGGAGGIARGGLSHTYPGGPGANAAAGVASGGGMVNAGTLTITNSTISGNSASDSGGGIVNAGTLTVINATIADNSVASGGSGGGLSVSASGTATLDNTIVGPEHQRAPRPTTSPARSPRPARTT